MQSNPLSLAYVGALLLILFGVMIFNDRPVQSPRPYEPVYTELQDRNIENYSYQSSSWEDPFEFRPEKMVEKSSYQIETGDLDEFAELKDFGKKLALSIHKNTAIHGSATNDEDGQNKESCGTQLTQLSRNEKFDLDKTRILFSTVRTHPRTIENKEDRIRQRHAVHAGLIKSGYSAAKPDRLNFCTSHATNAEKKYDVRWEYFKNNYENVIVIWKDDNEVNIQKKIYGTANACTPCTYFDSDVSSVCSISSVIQNYNFCYSNQYYSYHKPEPEPSSLAGLLKQELGSRRITQLSEIAIITEQGGNAQDNPKIRELEKAFCDPPNKNDKNDNPCKVAAEFSFFKGLDANQQAIKKRDEPDPADLKNWSDYFSLNARGNPAIGHAQFDYLHRLSNQIKAINKQSQREEHTQKIKAVGIFASDFYDKLILLEALWRENSNIIYFTTDLDAQMLQPEYWNWTRNLIVASPFGLRLKDDLQQPFPAFRDSRQTETYYWILKEIGGLTKKIDNTELKALPRIFEIGRNGPVDLYVNSEDSVHPPNKQLEQLKYFLPFAFAIVLALIITEYQIRPNSGAQTFWLLGTTIVIFPLIWFLVFMFDDTEPFSFTDGISMWPALLIRTLTIFLTIAFIIKTIRNLEVSFDRLDRKGFAIQKQNPNLKARFLDNSRMPEGKILKQIAGSSKQDKSAEDQKGGDSSILKSIFTVIFVVVVVTAIALPKVMSLTHTPLFAVLVVLTLLVVISFRLLTELEGQELLVHNSDLHKLINGFVAISFLALIPIVFLSDFLWLVVIIQMLYFCFLHRQTIQQLLKLSRIKSLFGILVLLAIFAYVAFSLIASHPELMVPVGAFLIFMLLCQPSIKSIQDWIERDSDRLGSLDGEHRWVLGEKKIWSEYREHGMLQQRLARTTIMWLIFITVDALLLHLFPIPASFCRGEWFCFTVDLTWIFSSALVIFLILLILDAQRLCIHWIEKLRKKHPLLVDRTIIEEERNNLEKESQNQSYNQKSAINESISKCDPAKCDKAIKQIEKEWCNHILALQSIEKVFERVAKRTHVVDQLVYFAIIALILMFFARIAFFDFQDFPLNSAITHALCISLLLYAGLKLRNEAIKLKRAIVDVIENRIIMNTERKQQVLDRIRAINYGAFQPMAEQPVVRSALLLLGSLGLFAAEYLMVFGY